MDAYCSSKIHVIKAIRNAICKQWDLEHPDQAPGASNPAPPPPAPPVSAPAPSGSPFPDGGAAPRPAAPAPVAPPRQAAAARAGPTNTGNQPLPPPTNADTPPLPTSTGNPGSPFGTDNDASNQSAGQTGSTGSMTAVYAGIGVAVVLALVLFAFMAVRVARNRRMRREEELAAIGRRDRAASHYSGTDNSISSPRHLENGPIPMAPGAQPLSGPMPVTETRNLGVSPNGDIGQSPNVGNNLFFDASQDMEDAGLGVTPPVFGMPTGLAASGRATPTYGYREDLADALVPTDFGSYPRASDQPHELGTSVPDDAFGESIYGDNYGQFSLPTSMPEPTLPTTNMASDANFESVDVEDLSNNPKANVPAITVNGPNPTINT